MHIHPQDTVNLLISMTNCFLEPCGTRLSAQADLANMQIAYERRTEARRWICAMAAKHFGSRRDDGDDNKHFVACAEFARVRSGMVIFVMRTRARQSYARRVMLCACVSTMFYIIYTQHYAVCIVLMIGLCLRERVLCARHALRVVNTILYFVVHAP